MKKISLGLLVCFLLLFTSCGVQKITTSTMELHKNGSLNTFFVEPFDTEKYQELDLINWVTFEINNYNDNNVKEIELQDLYVDTGNAMLSLEYPSYEDYMKLNGEVLFFGTIEEAMGPEFCLEGEYFDAQGEIISVTKEMLRDMEKSKIWIATEPILFKPYKEAIFYSQNIEK